MVSPDVLPDAISAPVSAPNTNIVAPSAPAQRKVTEVSVVGLDPGEMSVLPSHKNLTAPSVFMVCSSL